VVVEEDVGSLERAVHAPIILGTTHLVVCPRGECPIFDSGAR
jgi:hypothetical protein